METSNLIDPPQSENPKQNLFKFVNVIDERCDNSGKKRLFPIYRSNQSVNCVQLPAITSTSASTKFATQDLTPNYRIDPNVTMQGNLYFNATVTVTTAIPNASRANAVVMSNGVNFGIDYLPLWACINNGDVLINDAQIENKEVATMRNLMARLAQSQTNNIYGNDPSALEYACSYSDVSLTAYNNLANLYSATDTYLPNGAYPIQFLVNGAWTSTPITWADPMFGGAAADVAVAAYVVQCRLPFNTPLPFAPFVYNNDQHVQFNSQGLEYIKNIKVNLTLNNGSSVFKILNSASTAVGTGAYYLGVGGAGAQTGFASLQAQPFGQDKPTLNYIVLEAPESAVIVRPSRSVHPVVSYEQYLKQQTPSAGAFATGAEYTLKSNLIPVSRVPSLILVGAVPNTYINSPLRSNFLFAPSVINQYPINLQWNNQTGRCATMTARDLYNCSRRNGINQDWLSWSGANVSVSGANNSFSVVPLCGGWIALKPAIDVSTSLTESPNVETNVNFYVNYTVRNQTNDDYSGQILNLYVYCLYNDAMVINASNGICEKITGVISPQDLLDTDQKAPAVTDDELVDKYVGGSLLGRMKNAFRKLKHHNKSSMMPEQGGKISGGVMSGGEMRKASSRAK